VQRQFISKWIRRWFRREFSRFVFLEKEPEAGNESSESIDCSFDFSDEDRDLHPQICDIPYRRIWRPAGPPLRNTAVSPAQVRRSPWSAYKSRDSVIEDEIDEVMELDLVEHNLSPIKG
jgi:hypothetical protein